MMDRWAEENNISESDLLRAKLKWMSDIEFDRFSFRRFGLSSEDEPDYETQMSMHRVLDSGMATDEEIKELLALIDHGRVAESANAKNLVDATQEERAEIVKTDIVRQTLRQRLGFASRSTGVVGKNFDEISKELELTDKEIEIASEELTEKMEEVASGELAKRPMHSRIEQFKKRLLDSIRVEVDDDGIPMIMADPNPLIFEFIPDKRDWSKVRVPKRKTIKTAAKHISENQSEEMLSRDYESLEQKFSSRLIGLLESLTEDKPQEDIGDSVGVGWLSLYLQGLSNPIRSSFNGSGGVEEGVHDAFGHAGIGRGFDRHGEWANPLAVISMLDNPIFDDFTEDEKEAVKRSVLTRFGTARIEQTYGTGFGENYDEDMDAGQWNNWIFGYTGDIQTVIDMLDDSDRAQVLNNDGSPKAERPTSFASISSASRSNVSTIARQDLTHEKEKNPGFASRSGVEESTKKQVVPDNERAAARKAKELIANGGSNEEIEKAIREAFTGVLVGMKDYIDNTKTNRGNKFNMVPRSVTITDTGDGGYDDVGNLIPPNSKRIQITGRVISKHLGEYESDINEDDIVGNFNRVMYFDKDGAEVLHTDLTVRPGVQRFGIGTALNARNEEIYRELGISKISLYGNSGDGRNGATHWPRNGYSWYDEDQKNLFLDILSEDVDNIFAGDIDDSDQKKRDEIKALIKKSRADKFGEGVTPAELLAWDDQGMALANAEIRYRRDISKPSPTSFASRSTKWKKNTHGTDIDLSAPNADIFEANENGETIQVPVPVGIEVIHPRTGKKVNLNTQAESSDFVEFGGDLSKVPDAHFIEAILMNSQRIPGDEAGGFRLMKPGGRFTSGIGGIGKAGTIKFTDVKTGAIIGIKFEASLSYVTNKDGELGWRMIPITQINDTPSEAEIAREVMAQGLLGFFGFEPAGTRIVTRSRFGAGEVEIEKPNSRRDKPVLPGLAMIIEFAQNRYPNVTDPERSRTDESVYTKVRPASILRMAILDAIIGNGDRNGANMLLSKQSDGTYVIVPIDHGAIGSGLTYDMTNIEGFLKDHFSSLAINLSSDNQKIYDMFKNMSPAELESLVAEVMKDYRQVQEVQKESLIKTMQDAIIKMVDLKDGQSMYPSRRAKEADLAELLYQQEKTINLIFDRINFISSKPDWAIADALLGIAHTGGN
jgi:hypothetical protein